MQKKLIAVAIAGLASSGVFAQSNVTVYGQIDLGIEQAWGTTTQNVKTNVGADSTTTQGVGNIAAGNGGGTAGTKTTMKSGLYQGSYVGFKGSEDLGGGMKVGFIIETDVAADGNFDADGNGQKAPTASTTNGQGLFANKAAILELTTGVGRFQFGRQQARLAELMAGMDPFLGKGPGGTEQMFPTPLQSTKHNNAIRYDIVVDGWFGGFQHAMSENQDKVTAGANPASSITTVAAGYKGGPIVAYYGRGVARDYLQSLAAAVTQQNIGRNATIQTLGGSYDFGVAKLSGVMVDGKASKNSADEANTLGNQMNAMIDYRAYMLGVTVPFGAHTAKVSYINTNDRRAFDMDGSSWGLGYEYSFSKRTLFYSRYAAVSNKNGALYGVSGAAGTYRMGLLGTGARTQGASLNADVLDQRTNGVVLGMQHSF